MKKILTYCRLIAYPLIVALVTVQLPQLSFAQGAGETLTITTYYPSPVGSYRDLTVAGDLTLDNGTADAPQIQWRAAGSLRHWNIEQFGDNLQFFTEDNADARKLVLASIEPVVGTPPWGGVMLGLFYRIA